MGAAFHADGRTDKYDEVTDAFRNVENAPKNASNCTKRTKLSPQLAELPLACQSSGEFSAFVYMRPFWFLKHRPPHHSSILGLPTLLAL